MQDVVIAGYLRTANSRARPKDPSKDCFRGIRADELLSKLLPELLARAGVSPEEVNDFIVGSAIGMNEQWTQGGRNPLLLANLSATTATKFVDQQCGSAMAAIHIGYMEILTGNADIVLVGGMEHLTRVPMDLLAGAANPRLFSDEAYRHWDMATASNMGLTAEKLAAQYGITRAAMDEWSVRSHRRAARAQEEGFFDGEILPIEGQTEGGAFLVVRKDQTVRPDTNLAALAGLKPAYMENGLVTAGNSSPLNAGATAMLLMSRKTAEKKGVQPLASIRSIGFEGVAPAIMGIGPVPASRKALQRANLEVKDIDCWEINEAFAVVALSCMQALGVEPDRVNVKGGALALGHPLGATGIRLVGTLARILALGQARYGLATACVGGGQGVSTIIERS